MYSLVSAIGVKKTAGARWEAQSIASTPISQLFAVYRRMFITLSNTFLTEPVTIELESLRAQYSASSTTITQYLTNLGNATITTTVAPVALNPKYVKYSDGTRAGYKATPVNLLSPNNTDQQDSQKTSLRIRRPGTDMALFHNTCLVTVNGFFHFVDYDGTDIYVVGGGASRLKSHQANFGIMSFREVGNIKCVPITDAMIFPPTTEVPLKNRTYLKLNEDIANKTVMLVLGGYLMLIDGASFFQNGNDVFCINWARIPFIRRFLDAQPYVDYSSLELPVSSNNPNAISVPQLMSNTVLTKFMKMPTSFFVILDTPEMFVNRISIKTAPLPGMFIAYKEPIYPLIVANGKVAEYWKTYEDGQWAVNVKDSWLHNRVASTVPKPTLQVIDDTDVAEIPATFSAGYLLEMGKDF